MEHKLKMVNRQKYFGKPYKRIGKEHYSELVESKRKYNLYPTRKAVDLRDTKICKISLISIAMSGHLFYVCPNVTNRERINVVPCNYIKR